MSALAVIPVLVFAQFLGNFEVILYFSLKRAELARVVLDTSAGGIHTTQHSLQSWLYALLGSHDGISDVDLVAHWLSNSTDLIGCPPELDDALFQSVVC